MSRIPSPTPCVLLAAAVAAVGCGTSNTSRDGFTVAQQATLLEYYQGVINDIDEDRLQLDISPDEPPFFITEECATKYQTLTTDPCGSYPGGTEGQCTWMLCELEMTLCTVNGMLAIAGATNTVKFREDLADFISVPVQEPAVRRALRDAALSQLATAQRMEAAIAGIDTSDDCSDSALVPVGPPNESTEQIAPLSKLETLLTLAFEQSLTTLDALVDDHVAESDRLVGFFPGEGETTGLLDGAKRERLVAASFLGGALTREIVDGTNMPASFLGEAGICTASDLSDAGLEARRLIRQSGADPSDVVAIPDTETDPGVTTDAFITLVRNRLAKVWARPAMTTQSNQDFLADTALRERDFAEARRLMADEIRAFARSYTADLGPLPDCTTLPNDDCVRYAATTNPPNEAPWPYYASFAVFNNASSLAYETAASSASSDPKNHPANIRVSLVLRQMAEVMLDDLTTDGTTPSDSRVATANAIGRRLSSLVSEELLGAVVAIRDFTTENVAVIVGSDRYDPNEMIAVTDVDALSCAMHGEIEGNTCAWSDVASSIVTSQTVLTPSQTIYVDGVSRGSCRALVPRGGVIPIPMGRQCTQFTIPNQSPRPDRVFILRKRAGAADQVPGGYEAYAVEWPVGFDTDPTVEYTVSYVVPRMLRRAAEILTPATSWCSRPKWLCAGTEFDARLPLEDELSEDGDAFESSWRTYLAKARRAADEADFFGREAANAIFQIDRVAEDALAEVEDLCGVTIPIERLAEELQELEDNYDPSDPASVPPTIALAADKLLSPPDVNRIKQCLGEEDLVEFVALGDQPLCAWYYQDPSNPDPDDSATLCRLYRDDADEVENANIDCPTSPNFDHGLFCQLRLPVRADDGDSNVQYTSVWIDEGDELGAGDPGDTDGNTSDLLRLFATPETSDSDTSGFVTPDTCKDIRILRLELENEGYGIAHDAWTRSVQGNAFLQPESVRELARGIRWEMKPGAFSTLYVNGTPATTTGDIGDGVGTCGPAGLSCNTPASSPFCGTVNCANTAARWEHNRRLGKAAVIARWLGGLDLSGFVVPFQTNIRPTDLPVDVSSVASSYTSQFGADWYGETQDPNDSDTRLACAGGSDSPLFTFHQPLLDQGGYTEEWYYYRSSCDGSENSRFAGFTTLGGDRPWGHEKPSNGQLAASRLEAAELLADFRTKGVSGRFFFDRSLVSQAYRLQREHLGAEFSDLPWTIAVPANGGSCGGFLPSVCPSNLTDRPGVAFLMGARSKVETEAFLDAIELLCEAAVQRDAPSVVNIEEFLNTLDGLPDEQLAELDPVLLVDAVETAANIIETAGQRIVLRNVPREVVEVLKGEARGVGVLTGGQYGQEVNRLRGALIEMESIPRQIGAELRAFARENRYFESELKLGAIKDELVKNQFQATRSRELANCARAVANIAGSGGIKAAFNPGGLAAAVANAAITCSDSQQQIRLAARAADLELQIIDQNEFQATVNLVGQFDDRVMNLFELGDRLSVAIHDFSAALLNLEGLRTRTARALRRALFVNSGPAKAMFRSNVTLRNQFNGARTRYWRARRDAIRSAYLARRAIEQRFGVRLDEISRDMTLVEAPKRWVGGLCNLDGIDYSVTKSEELGKDIDKGVRHFSDGYVGEYVTKLENFVQSYSLDFPFQAGEDTAVISLRDDVQNVRTNCPVDVPNELAYSSRMDVLASTNATGWRALECVDSEPNCVGVASLDAAADGFTPDGYPFGAPVPFRLTFGPQHPLCVVSTDDPCPCSATACGWTPEAKYGQTFVLDAATYRVSWYQRASLTPDVAIERAVLDTQTGESNWTAGWPVSALDITCGGPEGHPGGWERCWFVFTPSAPESARLTIAPQSSVQGAQVDIAGIMVESVGLEDLDPNGPAAYFATSGELLSSAELCEDTDGTVFRSRGWRRSCVRLCDSGFAQSCTNDQSSLYCYKETDFTITHRAIERAQQLALSGFARGNFNFRIDSVGVNFVGASARDCSEVAEASTCYSAGWIPYTLIHNGPHRVHNHEGNTYRALLFPGVIEHARGLATQRYLTNPLSSADTQQIGQFMQGQYRGRPLTGTYTLRIWEEPGVNFDGIEDVQILLNYRFWTRQE